MKHDSVDTSQNVLGRLGLQDFALLLLDIAEPFTPLIGQALWVLQPSLGLVMDRQRVGEWAKRMENPEAMTQLRNTILGDDHD